MTAHQTTAHPPYRQGGPAAHGQPVVGPQGAMLPHGVPGYAPQLGVGVQLGVGAQPQLPTAPANQQPPVTSRQVPPTPMTNDPQAPDPRVQRYFASLAGPNLSHGNQNYHGRSDFGQTRSGQVTLSGQASPLQSRIGQSRWGLSTFNQTQVGQNQRNYSQHLMRAPDRLTNKTDALLLP